MSSIQSLVTEIDDPSQLVPVKEAANMPRGHKDPLWAGISIRLVNLRLKGRISSTDLAQLAGVAHSTVLEIENTARVPRVESAERIACALGVSPSWLCFGCEGDEPFRERIRRTIGHVEKEPKAKLSTTLCPEAFRGIPGRLKLARELLGMSLRAVARESGLSAQSLSTTELGTTVPTVENVEAIAKALGVSPGWLAFGIGRGPDGKKTKARAVA